MTRTRTLWLALAFIAVGGSASRAADPKPVEPTLAFQLKSIEGILADVKYLAKLANQADAADQLDGLIAAYAGPNGLAGSGVDVKRPFLAYAIAKPGGPTDQQFAIMLPIADEKTFLRLLESLNVKAEKGKDDIYTLDLPQSPAAIYFRFANKYVYVSALEREHLNLKNIVAPESIAVADPNTMVNLSVRFDRIPEDFKKMALSQIELRLAAIKDLKPANEGPDQAQARRQGIDFMSQVLKVLLSDGKSLQVNWSVDRAKDDIALAVSIDGQPDTLMSTVIGAMAGSKTRFTAAKGAAFHIGVNAGIPVALRQLITPFIDMGAKDMVAKESDANKRDLMTKVINAVLPTIKAGELDLHIAAAAPSGTGHFQVLAALGVKEGQAIESAAKELLALAPPDQRAMIKLDAAKAGGYNLHQVKPDKLDAVGQQLFGPAANVWAGFSASSMVIGLGADAAATCETIVTHSSPVNSPLLLIEGSLSRLAGLDPTKVAGKAAAEVFGANPNGNDNFRISLEGGKELKLAFSFKGLAIKMATVANEKKGGQ